LHLTLHNLYLKCFTDGVLYSLPRILIQDSHEFEVKERLEERRRTQVQERQRIDADRREQERERARQIQRNQAKKGGTKWSMKAKGRN
jgi:hypothetical protein